MGWPFDMISQSTKTWDELRFRAGVVYNVKFQVSQPKESSKESPKYNSALVLRATASKNQEDRSPEDKNRKKEKKFHRCICSFQNRTVCIESVDFRARQY